MISFRPLVLLAAAPFVLAACKSADEAGDVGFARSTFESLAKGETAVQEDIDWQTLNALGVNVGSQYIAIASETERAEFRTAFITEFATSFRDSGGSLGAFTNWRVTGERDNHTEVSADSPNGVLRLTVTEREDVERVSKLEMIQ